MENAIDVSKLDLIEIVKAAYDLSRPVGLGYLHYDPEPLINEEAADLINLESKKVVALDYVRGRAVKFRVFKENNKLYIKDTWYDHTKQDLEELLRRAGLERT
jgi:hypothetical protein